MNKSKDMASEADIVEAGPGPEATGSSAGPAAAAAAAAAGAAPDAAEAERLRLAAERKALANKKKRDKKKAKKAEEPLDPAVAAAGADFESYSLHKFFQGPISLRYNKVEGRYVAAATDLPAGTVVFEQTPYAGVVVDPFVSSICAACFGACTSVAVVCSKCHQSRYCSKRCMQTHAIHPYECDSLRLLPSLGVQGESAPLRVIIRAMLQGNLEEQALADEKKKLAQRNPLLRDWRPRPGCSLSDVRGLMTHADKLPQDTLQAIMRVMDLLGRVVPAGVWGPDGANRALELYLQTKVNAYYITDLNRTIVGLGLFAAASCLNHSCLPTCSYHFGPGGSICIRTLRAVKAGEELSYSYMDLYAASFERRKQLRDRYFFDALGGPRLDPPTIAAEDAVVAGLRCLACGTGLLNYHRIKAEQFFPGRSGYVSPADSALPAPPPPESALRPPATVAAAAAAAATAIAAAASTAAGAASESKASSAAAAAPSPASPASPEADGDDGEADEAKGKLAAPAPPVVTAETKVKCDGCGAQQLTVGQVDAWLDACQTYFDAAVQLLRGQAAILQAANVAPAEAPAVAAHLIETAILPLATGPAPIASAAAAGADAMPVVETAAARAAAKARLPPAPSRDVAKLHVFHRVMLNAYMGLVQASRHTADFRAMLKYAQLTAAALAKVGLADHPESADAALSHGDALAFFGGVPQTDALAVGSALPPLPIADKAAQTTYRKQALAQFATVLQIRAAAFGAKHALTRQALNKVRAIEAALGTPAASAVPAPK